MRWLVLAGTLWASSAVAGVVDRVVVVVDNQLILQSDIALEQAIALVDSSPSPFWASDRSTAKDRLTQGAMLRLLAGDLSLYQPSDVEVLGRLVAVQGQFDSPAAWQAFVAQHHLDAQVLRQALARRMIVERYLARNLHQRPDDADAWSQVLEQLMSEARSRFRIREVPIRAQGMQATPS